MLGRIYPSAGAWEVESMPSMSPMYSVNEVKKPPEKRVYHNNSACRPFQDIPQSERRGGMNGYRLCDDCERLNGLGR
jgi:hypothetical protein